MRLLEDQIGQVADFFAGRIVGDRDVLQSAALDRRRLDYSLESVKAVDEWLERLRATGVDPQSQEASETIIWAGAYVGEVIRRNAKLKYRWMRYEDYMASQPQTVRNLIPYSFGTQFILAAGSSTMTLPINKVGRWLDEGPENNLHYYASGDIKRE